MSDLYTEVLVKKQQTGKDKAIKGVLIFFTVLFAAAGIMMNPLSICTSTASSTSTVSIRSQEEKEPQAMSFPTWKSWLRTSPISSIPTKTIRASNVTTIPPESKDRATNRMHL